MAQFQDNFGVCRHCLRTFRLKHGTKCEKCGGTYMSNDGKAMTNNLYKKKKIKQKSVKFGKTLVVEDGKIIRTALYYNSNIFCNFKIAG